MLILGSSCLVDCSVAPLIFGGVTGVLAKAAVLGHQTTCDLSANLAW